MVRSLLLSLEPRMYSDFSVVKKSPSARAVKLNPNQTIKNIALNLLAPHEMKTRLFYCKPKGKPVGSSHTEF